MEYCKIFFVYKGNSDLCDTVLTDIFNPVELALPAVPALRESKRSSPDHTFHERTPSPTDDSDSVSSIQRRVDDEDEYENIFAPFKPDHDLLQGGVEDEDQFSPPPPDSASFEQEGVEDEDQFSPPPVKRPRTAPEIIKYSSRAKEVLNKLRQEKKNRQKEKELIKKNLVAMKSRAQQERAKLEAAKEVISEADLRQLCIKNRYNLKDVSISIECCDAMEVNKGDLNSADATEANKGDLSSADAMEANKGDLNSVDATEGNKADLNSANVNGNKCRSAKPKSLAEADPLLNAFKENRPDEVQDLLNDDNKEKRGTSLITEDKLKMNDGEIEIKESGIKRRQKQVKNLKCPDTSCTVIFDFVKQMNAHVKEKHPNFRFKCNYCVKTYMTYNTRYKHEHSHFKLLYVCHYCEKRFLFPALRTKHENLHTGKGLLPCMWPGCKQQLSCKDALQQHINTHTEERFMCDKCNKTFNTITNLKQHEKGKHGEGYIALCGAVYD